jgi:Glycosyltransferases involved in cell wall biogenesis
LRDIEILVVVNGSTDRSLAVAQQITQGDECVSIFSQANSGQSVARNVGIKKAKGQYIYFMDSGDVLRSDALLKCYERAVRIGCCFMPGPGSGRPFGRTVPIY